MPIKPKFATKNRETILPSKLAQIINDLIAILLFAISLMLSLALATHSSLDSGWSKTVDSPTIYNKLGLVGAYLSDILYYIFGYSAWWLAIGLFYLGYYKISRKKFYTGNWNNIYQIISYILLLVFSAAFEYIAFYHQQTMLPDGVGGSLGAFLFNSSYRMLGQVGIALSSLVMIVICFSFAFGVSWGGVAEKIGAFLEYIYLKLTQLVARKDDATDQELAVKTNKEDIKFDLADPFNMPEKKEVPADSDIDSDVAPALEKKGFFSNPFTRNNTSLATIMDPDSLLDKDIGGIYAANEETYLKQNILDDFPAEKADDLTKTSSASSNSIIKKSMTKSDLLAEAARGSLPSTSLLNSPKLQSESVSPETIEYVSNTIENTLAEFGVNIQISNVESGPVITRYELVPPKGVRGDKIASLAKEIARSLALPSIRVVETIPGKNSMGIEVPNFKRQVIYLKEIFESNVYKNNSSLLTLALGKDIAGDVIVTDLAKMPHLLVAGTTGSGKSVAVNAMILSILFNARPDEVKFIMIDPKMVELSFYQDIPHLLAPVVTDMSQAANALKWTVGEMEQRYKIMAKVGTKNIIGFNQKIEAAINNNTPIYNPYSIDQTDPEPLQKWPYIVVIIDELADLMMVAGKKIEQYIARIAQKARAVGIHLIVATQRPSVDVITGLIKANIPARISFQVSSKIDSRTILDQMGAEALLGQGDMLMLMPGSGFLRRIHGAFVNDDELHKVVEFLKTQGFPEYNDEILTGASDVAIPGFEDDSNSDNINIEKECVFDEAVKFILDSKRCSISSLQTQFGIGYNKAARIMNHLEKVGMVRRNEKNTFELLNH